MKDQHKSIKHPAMCRRPVRHRLWLLMLLAGLFLIPSCYGARPGPPVPSPAPQELNDAPSPDAGTAFTATPPGQLAPTPGTLQPGVPATRHDPQSAVPPAAGWRLIWNDEFDGTSIDTSKWEVMGRRSWGCWARRLGWWSEEDAYLDGHGNLVLRTREVPLEEFRRKCSQDARNPWGAKYWDNEYVSGAIRSRGRFERAFGYFEARVAFPYDATSPGHWPAFWLYNDTVNRVDHSGRDGTEIDIFEYWKTDYVSHALHWDGYGDAHQEALRKMHVPGLSTGYHVFGLLWTPEMYVFYIDGKETWRSVQGGVAQTPLYIKLTEEIDAFYGLVSEADLPHHTLVDYVRVYETPPMLDRRQVR